LNEEQRVFLDAKLETLSKLQPGILKLRTRLLHVGGIQMVAPGSPDPDLDAILSRGSLQDYASVLVKSDENSCHRNISAMWLQNKLLAIGTGYALSEDGLWRQHTWGVGEVCIVKRRY